MNEGVGWSICVCLTLNYVAERQKEKEGREKGEKEEERKTGSVLNGEGRKTKYNVTLCAIYQILLCVLIPLSLSFIPLEERKIERNRDRKGIGEKNKELEGNRRERRQRKMRHPRHPFHGMTSYSFSLSSSLSSSLSLSTIIISDPLSNRDVLRMMVTGKNFLLQEE